MRSNKKYKVAILGSGNIGTDLLVKVNKSPYLECSYFVGRNSESNGISKAKSMGIRTSTQSIDALTADPDSFDLVFDATSAAAHKKHAVIFEKLSKKCIDLTPSNIGEMCVPAVNLQECTKFNEVNLITCGGQAAIPIVYALGRTQPQLKYVEIVSSISSMSAGPATRENLDEYIETTENALRVFSGCSEVKSILNLNPAIPQVDMKTTIMALVDDPNISKLQEFVNEMIEYIQHYVPGYELVVPPTIENNRIVIMVKVRGNGDYLPRFAGNLDIINCAAIAIAEKFAINCNNEENGYEASCNK